MDKKLLIAASVIVSVIAVSVFGCATVPPQEKTSKNEPKNVRLSGDVTVTTVNRSGF